MKKYRRFFDVLFGFALCVGVVVGCATTSTFPWPYYAPNMPDTCYDQGVLLGKAGTDGWPDLSLDECKPDPVQSPSPGVSPSPGPSPVLLKCMVVKVDDFYSIKADDEKCHADLVSCQQGPNPIVSGRAQ